MSIADQAHSGRAAAGLFVAGHPRQFTLTRRHLQVALGLTWLLDGCLQLQPFMFSRGFVTGVLEPATAGQPHVIAVSILGVAHLMARHLAFYNTCAAVI